MEKNNPLINNPLINANIKLNYTKAILLVFISSILVSFSGARAAEAASLYFSPSPGSYNVGQTFSIGVYVSSAEQAMNAVSGAISFPQDKLEISSLSKTSSIINLWVQEPIFSNNTGTVSFEGIVLNPGFTGSAGKIITLNLKAKAAGSVSLNFSSGSILANDGKGTNILTAMTGGNYNIQTIVTPPPTEEVPGEQYLPPVTAGTPLAPNISSTTHPQSEKWYSNNDPEFSWKLPSDVTALKLLLDKEPSSLPVVLYTPPISEKKIEDLEDGIWYFHIRFKNQSGWGGVLHRKVLIDTKPPEPFEIKVDNEGDSTNPTPILHFETKDSPSGIKYYEIKIGEGDKIPVIAAAIKGNPFKMPVQAPGKHTAIVSAVDGAGNLTLASTELIIEPLEPAIITDFPQKAQTGDILFIKGTSKYPNAIVMVFVKKEGEEPIGRDVKTDKQGNWSFIYERSLEKGTYQFWTEITDARGAKSRPSEKITIGVSLPPLIKFGKIVIDYLAVIVSLLALIVVLILIIFYGWLKASRLRKKLRKETKDVQENVIRAFRALKEKVEDHIEKLDKKPGLTKKEKKLRDNLQETLNISEKFITKEIKDIFNELK